VSLCPGENDTIYPLIWTTQGTGRPRHCFRGRPAGGEPSMWSPASWRRIRRKAWSRLSGERSETNCEMLCRYCKTCCKGKQMPMFSCPISPTALSMRWRNCDHVGSISRRRYNGRPGKYTNMAYFFSPYNNL
jgi:hypothetical protein